MGTPAVRRLLCTLVVAAAAMAQSASASMLMSTSERVTSPKADAQYRKLVDAANSVVGIKMKAIPNAHSNDLLGQERSGSGVVIDSNGLVLTIGYLIMEADQIQITDSQGETIPATMVAYDHATGFGLVRAMGKLKAKPIKLGTASPVSQLDRLLIVTGGDEQTVSIATVVARRQFAGYWEYKIDGAIFTSPPRLDHSGAALLNKDGELVGIGSLFVMDAITPGEKFPGNMFVPIDLLKPALDEMVKSGAQAASRRPWLGVNSLEEDGRVKVLQVNEESPAEQAGIAAGDIILSINGLAVDSLDKFYDKLWSDGAKPGKVVKLTVLHGPVVKEVDVRSIDRTEYMRRKTGL
jgi:serine protease Do